MAAVEFGRCAFQGFATGVCSLEQVEEVVLRLRRDRVVLPRAWRLESGVEGFDDDSDLGTGAKLLALLRQWEIEDVVLLVARDDSRAFIEGNYLGARRYKISVDCAKSVLRACFAEHGLRETPAKAPAEEERPIKAALPRLLLPILFATAPESEKSSPQQNISNGIAFHLTSAERAEIRSIRRPPPQVESILRAVCATAFGATWWSEEKDWDDIRLKLAENSVNDALSNLQRGAIPTDLAATLVSSLVAANLGPTTGRDNLRKASTLALTFMDWLWKHLEPYLRAMCSEEDPAHEEILPHRRKHHKKKYGPQPPESRRLAVPTDNPEDLTRIANRLQANPC